MFLEVREGCIGNEWVNKVFGNPSLVHAPISYLLNTRGNLWFSVKVYNKYTRKSNKACSKLSLKILEWIQVKFKLKKPQFL